MNSVCSKKVALIGGITGGIGSALADALSQNNWTVGGFGRDANKLLALKNKGFDVQETDATDSSQLNEMVTGFADKFGKIDLYVHCVGSVFLKPLHLTTDEDFQSVLSTNLTSAFKACRSVMGPMRKAKSGTILLISSVAAQSGLSNHEAIAAAKGGIEGLVKSMAATYAANGIRVNGIAPGLVETPATAAITGNAQARTFSEKMHPLGRLGRPEEIASLLAWLASVHGEWITGQIIRMDGGMSSLVAKPRA